MYTLVFTFPVRLCLQTKLLSFLTTDYTANIDSSLGTNKPMKIQHKLYEPFHNGYRAMKNNSV